MKTFTSALHALRSTQYLLRDLSRISFHSFSRLLCIERKGALVCCIPGAPIVRLPAH